MTSTIAKDLTKEPPRSPRVRLGNYVILARALDKGRASNVGEYHYDCPLDKMLFDFKGVTGDEVKKLIQSGASDEEVVTWLNSHGTPKTAEEVNQFSNNLEAAMPYQNPERKEWFVGVCKPLGIDPEKSSLFDFLEADDRQTFAK